jgi:5-carboxymethyl-2-hydroxymuconate isomerase
VAEGEGPSAFVHLDIRFLEGRSPEVKRAIGDGALDLLHKHFAPGAEEPEGLDFQITIEIRDIHRVTYFKYPPGTLGPPSLSVV